jgi:hypothetical protein
MQQEAQTRKEPHTPNSQQTSMKDLDIFLATIVLIGHDHMPSIKPW